MSEDIDKLDRELLAVTSPSCDEREFSGEQAAMREAWTALGELIECGQPAASEPLRLRVEPWRRRAGGRRVAATAALAASLAVAAGAAWWLDRQGGTAAPGPGASTVAGVDRLVPAAPRKAIPAAAAPGPQAETPEQYADWAWDDQWDEQVAQFGDQLVSAEEDWGVYAQTAQTLGYGIDQAWQSGDLN